MEEEKILSEKENLDQQDENKLDLPVKNHVMPILRDLAGALCVIIILFMFCFRVAEVNGQSMQNTLQHGDNLLLLNNFIAGEPKHGDIVVISKESYKSGEPIIKRVIATEGQTVDIDIENGVVKVDGEVLYEPYIKELTHSLFEGVEFPLTVEEGCVFVMGDNRNNSRDSRYPTIGQIDCREIVGKAIFLIFPGDKVYSRIGAID